MAGRPSACCSSVIVLGDTMAHTYDNGTVRKRKADPRHSLTGYPVCLEQQALGSVRNFKSKVKNSKKDN